MLINELGAEKTEPKLIGNGPEIEIWTKTDSSKQAVAETRKEISPLLDPADQRR